jgi:16S rRNA C967 or C1407 C5-methylase (RsmB/RsmF family)
LQKQIIQNTIGLLKKWWELVYSTCTISPEENEDICHMILCNFPEMKIEEINLDYKYVRDWLTKYQNKHFKNEIKKTKRVITSKETEGFFVAKFKKNID